METPGSKPIDELVRLAIIGDGTAFTKLWDTYIDSLRAFVRTFVTNVDDFLVEDICSRSFEKAFRQIGSYDPSKSQFFTWLRTIARNTALDLVKQEARLHKQVISIDGSEAQVSVVENIGDEVESPLETIIKYEDREETKKYIDGLPELYREVASKRLLDGLQYKEIADDLGMELNTVRTRIRRAKAMIDKMKFEEELI